MADGHHPEFRLGPVLSTSFTGTLSERYGRPVERLPTPERLADWLGIHGLPVTSCTTTQLDQARQLREAIHTAATATALGQPLPTGAIRTINRHSTAGSAARILDRAGDAHWELGASCAVEDALGVIAGDAIAVLSGERAGRISLCASPTCRAAFLDTSRGGTRRWCDMNTCGNKQKKARLRAG